MKFVTLYKPNGEVHCSYRDVSVVATADGVLKFRFERNPGERVTMEEVETSLPFIINDNLER